MNAFPLMLEDRKPPLVVRQKFKQTIVTADEIAFVRQNLFDRRSPRKVVFGNAKGKRRFALNETLDLLGKKIWNVVELV